MLLLLQFVLRYRVMPAIAAVGPPRAFGVEQLRIAFGRRPLKTALWFLEAAIVAGV